MLEPVMRGPMLNSMHRPLANQLIARSIHSLGGGPMGWRYPGALFGFLDLSVRADVVRSDFADIGRVHRHVDGYVQSPDNFPKLDLSARGAVDAATTPGKP